MTEIAIPVAAAMDPALVGMVLCHIVFGQVAYPVAVVMYCYGMLVDLHMPRFRLIGLTHIIASSWVPLFT